MIYLGADHHGFELKEKVKKWLTAGCFKFKDLGNTKFDTEDDYPDFAKAIAKKLGGDNDLGILVCGSGVGMDIVANKFKGVRCGLGFSPQQVRLAKRDDNINCLSLSADYVSEADNKVIVQMFLETKFSGGEKYQRRIDKIEKLK